jgi:hypothetical protein
MMGAGRTVKDCSSSSNPLQEKKLSCGARVLSALVDTTIVTPAAEKNNLAIYIIDGFDDKATLLSKLGKHSTGKSCLYVKRLSDLDEPTLTKLITQSFTTMQKRYKEN